MRDDPSNASAQPPAGLTRPSEAFARLLEIIQRLRSSDGCAWDRAQTPATLRGSLVEEVWECVSAIDAGDQDNLSEELGDLYLLVTMIAWMKEQEGAFTISSALTRIAGQARPPAPPRIRRCPDGLRG